MYSQATGLHSRQSSGCNKRLLKWRLLNEAWWFSDSEDFTYSPMMCSHFHSVQGNLCMVPKITCYVFHKPFQTIHEIARKIYSFLTELPVKKISKQTFLSTHFRKTTLSFLLSCECIKNRIIYCLKRAKFIHLKMAAFLRRRNLTRYNS
jgi:hypothetical protein